MLFFTIDARTISYYIFLKMYSIDLDISTWDKCVLQKLVSFQRLRFCDTHSNSNSKRVPKVSLRKYIKA